MSISLSEIQTISKLASHLYSFLPGTPNPFANPHISFAGIARSLRLEKYWPGGSKSPAITTLLEGTLSSSRDKFCSLILTIVKESMKYRINKKPLNRGEIEQLNDYVKKLGFKIPELWDPKFLQSLPSIKTDEDKSPQAESEPTKKAQPHLLDSLINIQKLTPQERGYAFEKFLTSLFNTCGLQPRTPFRLVGEQIDGSIDLDSNTYLIEAKWQNTPVSNAELLVFHGKVGGKATWARGIFISYSGFTRDGLDAFSRGRTTNLIAIDGLDLSYVLEGKILLVELIRLKARRAAEEGRIMVSAKELS